MHFTQYHEMIVSAARRFCRAYSVTGLFYLKIYRQLTHTNAPAAASMHHAGVAVHPHYSVVGCVFGACDLSLRMVVHYTSAMLYLMPFIGAWGLPPPVERCIPALVVYLYPAMFGIAQGGPTPGCMPAPVTFYTQVCLLSWKHRQHLFPCQTPTVSLAPSEGVQRAVLTKQQRVSQGQMREPLQPKKPLPPNGR